MNKDRYDAIDALLEEAIPTERGDTLDEIEEQLSRGEVPKGWVSIPLSDVLKQERNEED